MTLIRWTPRERKTVAPFHPLAGGVERLFDDFFTRTPAWFALPEEGGQAYIPGVDVRETQDAYVVEAAVPGFARENLAVEVKEGVLTLTGTYEAKEEKEGEGYHRSEIRTGNFTRRVRLPGEVEAEGHEAKLKDGVLAVTLKKAGADAPEARKVEIAEG